MNLALVRSLTPESTLYVDGAYSHRTPYVEFEDFTLPRGERRLYWMEDPPASGATANFLMGGFFRLAPRVLAPFGFETAPPGISVGVRYTSSS